MAAPEDNIADETQAENKAVLSFRDSSLFRSGNGKVMLVELCVGGHKGAQNRLFLIDARSWRGGVTGTRARPGCTAGARQNFEKRRMTLLQWLEDYTIIHELGWLAVVWIAIVQPPLAVFWVLRKRQSRAR